MKREIIARIEVDDEMAFNTINDGPIAYLESEFGWLRDSGIYLKEAFIADDDEDDVLISFVTRLMDWIFENV